MSEVELIKKIEELESNEKKLKARIIRIESWIARLPEYWNYHEPPDF